MACPGSSRGPSGVDPGSTQLSRGSIPGPVEPASSPDRPRIHPTPHRPKVSPRWHRNERSHEVGFVPLHQRHVALHVFYSARDQLEFGGCDQSPNRQPRSARGVIRNIDRRLTPDRCNTGVASSLDGPRVGVRPAQSDARPTLHRPLPRSRSRIDRARIRGRGSLPPGGSAGGLASGARRQVGNGRRRGRLALDALRGVRDAGAGLPEGHLRREASGGAANKGPGAPRVVSGSWVVGPLQGALSGGPLAPTPPTPSTRLSPPPYSPTFPRSLFSPSPSPPSEQVSLCICAVSDASHRGQAELLDEWSALENFRSQSSKLTLLSEKHVINNHLANKHLISFGSTMAKLVVNSTIKAEQLQLIVVVEAASIRNLSARRSRKLTARPTTRSGRRPQLRGLLVCGSQTARVVATPCRNPPQMRWTIARGSSSHV